MSYLRLLILMLFLSSVILSQTIVQEITTNTTWTAANSPYILQGGNTTDEISLYIHNDNQPVTLTIEAGVTIIGKVYRVNFGGGSYNDEPQYIRIGKNGAIKVNGTSANPVRFTSDESSKNFNQWGGIIIEDEANTGNIVFTNTIFEAAGFELSAAVEITSGSPKFNYCTFTKCERGIYGEESASPVITNSTFSDNNRDGIELNGGGAIITGNTFTGNETAVDLWLNFPQQLENNLFGADQQIILPENITENAEVSIPGYFLSGGKAPYLLRYPAQVNDISVNVRAATLTINKGVEIIGGTAIPLWPNEEPCYLNLDTGGSLVVNGTENEPVLFTSDEAEKGKAQWGGIVFSETANNNGSLINYAIIESAGFEFDACVNVYSGSVQISNSTIRNGHKGIYVSENATPVIEDCYFNDFTYNAIEMEGSGSTIRGNKFENMERGVAIDMWHNFPKVIENNIMVDNDKIMLPELIDKDYTMSIPGILPNGTTAAYYIRLPGHANEINVTIENCRLTISPGVEIRAKHHITNDNDEPSFILVKNGGKIKSEGTINNPVLFGNYDNTIWGGIIFESTADNDNSMFEYTTFHRGGFEFDATVIINSGSPVFENCMFTNNSNSGLSADSGSTPRITGSQFTASYYSGVLVKGNSGAVITSSTIDSSRWGIDIDNGTVDVSNSTIMHCNDGIRIYDGNDVKIDGCVFKENNYAGITIQENAPTTLSVENSSIRDNYIGIDSEMETGSDVQIHNSDISNNSNKGIVYRDHIVIDARNNWWGDASGPLDNSDDSNDPTKLYNPNGLGNSVSDYIDYGDWLRFLETEAPNILCAYDVPNDQGRWMHICWSASSLDAVTSTYPIVKYSVWRKVEENNNGTQRCNSTGLMKYPGLVETMANDWDYIHDVTAVPEFNMYYYVVPTLGDSNMTGIVYSTFMVIAHTANPGIYFKSNSATGYSIDNLAPNVPAGLKASPLVAGGYVALSWTRNTDEDLNYYIIYRDNQPVGETVDTNYTNTEVLDGNYGYCISAVDYNGNESPKCDVINVLVGVENTSEKSGIPVEFSLSQNYPNPFNPETTIKFTLPSESHVKLYLLNITGERIHTILDERLQAAYHSINFDAGNLASGVYFYVIEVQAANKEAFRKARKMLVLK